MWTLLLVTLSSASAQDCDVRALKSRLKTAAPTVVGAPFAELAACDAAAAKQAAPGVFERLVSSSSAKDAVLAGIRVGANAEVLGWLDAQEPDVRSRAVSHLGSSCTHDEVGTFFSFVHDEKKAQFWEERWHRGLAQCRTPAVRELLEAAVDGNEVGRAGRNRTQFYSLLEVYARNLGSESLPKLETFLSDARDEKEAVAIVSVLPDAAGVGSAGGPDKDTADAIVAAIERVAPKLAPKAIDTVRTAMASLGREQESGAFAKYRWPDAYTSGAYTYGLAVVEDITCKNGSQRAILHYGEVTEGGATWPDMLAPRVDKDVRSNWEIDGARKCKGESTITVELTPVPLGVDEDFEAWSRRVAEAFGKQFGGAKTWIVAEDGFGY